MPCRGEPCGLARDAGGVRSECTMPRPATIQLTSPWADHLFRSHAVAMHQLAFEQVGNGGEPDVWMRPHVYARALRKGRGPNVIEEDKRTDRAPTARGQQSSNGETAEIARPPFDDAFDCAHRAAAVSRPSADLPCSKTTSTGISRGGQPLEIGAQLRANQALLFVELGHGGVVAIALQPQDETGQSVHRLAHPRHVDAIASALAASRAKAPCSAK